MTKTRPIIVKATTSRYGCREMWYRVDGPHGPEYYPVTGHRIDARGAQRYRVYAARMWAGPWSERQSHVRKVIAGIDGLG
mgnify:FL=1